MEKSVLRRTAAEIAAVAVYELYPDVQLLGGGESSTGFFYDFYFPHPLHVHLIEEKMRGIVRDRREVRTLQMVPFSAGELLKSQGHICRLEDLPEEGFAEVVQIGNFYDLAPGPHLKNTAELAAFKIQGELLADKKMRIVGWCESSKDELKKFLKVLSEYQDPRELGERMGLWQGEVWFPPGLKMRGDLIQFLKKMWFQGAFEILAPGVADRIALHRSLGKPKVAESWQSEEEGEAYLQVSFFGSSEEEFNSCLQLIGKTLTILGFDHSTAPRGRGVDYLVLDGLGRSHPLVCVKKVSKKGALAVDFYLIASVEQILFQMLEKNLMMVKLENQ